MRKKIEIKDIFGNVLFVHECENNSIKKTVEEAVMQDISLCMADLRCAFLHGANLRGAYLYGANLYGANLSDANLRGADLHCAKNEPFIPISCPSDGSFIGWKKIRDCLVKLLIPEDAKRSSATTNKCRCDKAKVLEIIDLTTNEHLDKIINEEYAKCVYRVGKMVYPDKFDKNRWEECSHGIHFFINKQEAVEYGF